MPSSGYNKSDDDAHYFYLGKWRWIFHVIGNINTHSLLIWQHRTLTTSGCKDHRDTTLKKKQTHKPNQPLHDQSREERKRVSWWSVGSTTLRMETQEEKRLFLFKWRQQEQLCTVSPIDCWEPPGEERLNG